MSAANRPLALYDPNNNVIYDSHSDESYQGDLDGGANLVYIGFARPGADVGDPVWQIRKVTYSGSTPIAIQWPENTSGNASNDYIFIWNNRASLTYA